MYKKIYINLDNISDNAIDEINKYNNLFYEKDTKEIWDKFRIQRLQKSFKETINDVNVLELFLLTNYIQELWYKAYQIELLINKPLFIHNDELYKIENWECILLDTEDVWFFSVRWSNWNYPFFFILEKIISKKWWKMLKTNDLNRNIVFKEKLYALNDLYLNREKYIGNIVIPYKIHTENYNIFISYLKDNLSSQIVLKKDWTQLWQWVFVVDLDNFWEIQEKKFNNMKTHNEFLKEIYIVPFEEFQEEYRVYFTKYNWIPKIYSLKKKKVTSEKEQIFNTESFEYYKNVMLEWTYINNSLWFCEYRELYEISLEYINLLQYNVWALEFWKTKDWRFIFFEVNSMADPICYEWEDMDNMTEFYNSIFKNFLN